MGEFRLRMRPWWQRVLLGYRGWRQCGVSIWGSISAVIVMETRGRRHLRQAYNEAVRSMVSDAVDGVRREHMSRYGKAGER